MTSNALNVVKILPFLLNLQKVNQFIVRVVSPNEEVNHAKDLAENQ
jgi:hypothetical protein